ncbi:MAG: MBL fold metallo-hydrolase [Methanoregula sp.]|uniref:MBL fold metallo-hydrolase n=1 Tax=Methanoregula sp. TaxID=2052170 RepID=UPI0025E1DF61|nr:MBL fold metallo-hydrolase [Methanoregula sp.]MCK9632262.1 MBL fold metallo-hydrolase [Methanoregula sp.]
MLFERFVSEGLAHFSYIIGSGGEAAVIDPRRDCAVYPDRAAENGMKITGIFETHRNEDYAVGSGELAAICGAPVYHGAALPFAYGTPVRDGDRFLFGDLVLTVRETPGHTMESISVVVTDSANPGLPSMVFSGDLLFAGDTGRTDLGRPGTADAMAGAMYDSIHDRVLPLGDGTIVLPAHGAGSVCGGAIADHPVTTIGFERKANPALSLDRAAFIAHKTAGHHYRPPYFRAMERFNREGWPRLPPGPHPDPVTPAALKDLLSTGVQVVDIRSPTAFAAGHIPGSISLWREGIPAFAGWVLNYDDGIVIVDDFNTNLDTVQRDLRRLGYDRLTGYLAGGFIAWATYAGEITHTGTCSVQEAALLVKDPSLFVLDVRDIRNREAFGHIEGSHHIYVGELPQHINEIPKDHPVLVYCDAGYKGSLAAGILARHGITRVTNLLGGFAAWKKAGYPPGK